MTPKSVARRAGTSRPEMSALETGCRHPTFDTIERVPAANGQCLVTVPDPVLTIYRDRRDKPSYCTLWHAVTSIVRAGPGWRRA